jgi:hypothetical protein
MVRVGDSSTASGSSWILPTPPPARADALTRTRAGGHLGRPQPRVLPVHHPPYPLVVPPPRACRMHAASSPPDAAGTGRRQGLHLHGWCGVPGGVGGAVVLRGGGARGRGIPPRGAGGHEPRAAVRQGGRRRVLVGLGEGRLQMAQVRARGGGGPPAAVSRRSCKAHGGTPPAAGASTRAASGGASSGRALRCGWRGTGRRARCSCQSTARSSSPFSPRAWRPAPS